MALTFVDGHEIQMSLDTSKFKYEKRSEVVNEYFQWWVLVASLRSRYLMLVAADIAVFIAGFFIWEGLLLALIPLLPLTLKAQFDWGDKLDDKESWQEKTLTRMDG